MSTRRRNTRARAVLSAVGLAVTSTVAAGAAQPNLSPLNACVVVDASDRAATTTARELQRYLYLAGVDKKLPRMILPGGGGVQSPPADPAAAGCGVVFAVATGGVHAWVSEHLANHTGYDSWLRGRDALAARHSSDADAHVVSPLILPTPQQGGGAVAFVLHGANQVATRYAAFSALEQLGFAFRLHGNDVVPVGLTAADVHRVATAELKLLRVSSSQQDANSKEQRLHNLRTPNGISVRGIQPFHDFSEGPDQWNTDDYKMCVCVRACVYLWPSESDANECFVVLDQPWLHSAMLGAVAALLQLWSLLLVLRCCCRRCGRRVVWCRRRRCCRRRRRQWW
jgi:hypothetical protein